MSDDIVNPEMRWTVTSEFMRKAAEDNEKRRELEAAVERMRDDLQKQADWADWAKGKIDRLERIIAAVREPSEAVLEAAGKAFWGDKLLRRHLRAAVAAAEQEVGP